MDTRASSKVAVWPLEGTVCSWWNRNSNCVSLGIPRFGPLSGIVNLSPVAPTNNSQIWLRGIRQHRKQLQQVPIGVSKIERCGGHPCNHHWFVGWRPVKVEWNDVRRSKTCRRAQQVGKIRSKGNVEA